MHTKLELLAKEIEQHITQDGCACCRTKEYLATIKQILEASFSDCSSSEQSAGSSDQSFFGLG